MDPSGGILRAVVTGLITFGPAVLYGAALMQAQPVPVASDTSDYIALCRQGSESVQRGDYQQAITQYRSALRIRPDAPDALNNLAVAYYEAKQYDDAFETAGKIWNTHRELRSAALIRGLSAVQLNRPDEAREPLELVLSSDARNRDALLGLASAYVGSGNLPEAIETYRKEISYAEADSQAWYGLAICFEKSAENASRALAQMPGGASYSKRLLAEYLQGLGDSKLAAEAFGQAEHANSAGAAKARAQYERARAFAGQSRRAFERFIELAPDSWQAAVFLADVERQHGNLAGALAQYQRATGAAPKETAPLLGLGTVYWEMGQFERSRSYLRLVLEQNPHSAQALFEEANIAVRQHREAEAIPLLKSYLAAQPDALAAHADLGRAYLHTGRYPEAVEELERAAAADEQGDIHYQLALALRKIGMTEKADRALGESARIREERRQREQRLQSAH